MSSARPTIGVFDSGFGGLTVLRALMHHLPAADYLYLGDTARLPYGSKSAETVTRYTAAAIHALTARGADFVVIACNTASALALPQLQAQCPMPVLGVIEPGAHAAAEVLQNKAVSPHLHAQCPVPAFDNSKPEAIASPSLQSKAQPVLVLATEATVASHAYAEACAAHGLTTLEKACPLLVPLVEEGWTDHHITAQVLEIYLREATANITPGAILLGCTHYPLLRPLLESAVHRLLGPIPIVDSAEATALHVCTLLPQAAAVNKQGVCPTSGFSDVGTASHTLPGENPPTLQCFATDSPIKFQRLGQRFLAHELTTVELIDLDT